MSEIDSYQHRCIGIVACPSSYKIVHGNDRHRFVPLYILEQDAPYARTWQAKKGDLLLGGGSGESAALRISIPEAIHFFADDEWDDFDSIDELFKAYWSMNQAFVFCDGYKHLGWSPGEVSIESWLTEHIIAFVLREYPGIFGQWKGDLRLERDGSICRLPTAEESRVW